MKKTLNPGDEVIIEWNQCKGQKGIVVELKGINFSEENVYWIKLKSGEQFSESIGLRENTRDCGLEHSFWVGWLTKIEAKSVEQYGIVKFCKEHYK